MYIPRIGNVYAGDLCLYLHLFRYLDLFLSCANFTMNHAASTCFNVFAVEIVSVFDILNHRPILCFLSLLYILFDLVGWVTAKVCSHDIPWYPYYIHTTAIYIYIYIHTTAIYIYYTYIYMYYNILYVLYYIYIILYIQCICKCIYIYTIIPYNGWFLANLSSTRF